VALQRNSSLIALADARPVGTERNEKHPTCTCRSSLRYFDDFRHVRYLSVDLHVELGQLPSFSRHILLSDNWLVIWPFSVSNWSTDFSAEWQPEMQWPFCPLVSRGFIVRFLILILAFSGVLPPSCRVYLSR
jgi:hypothetical protein